MSKSTETISTLPASMNEREAAAFLGISPRNLWSRRMRGEVPHQRIGRRVIYLPDQLREWQRQQSEGGDIPTQ